MAAQDGWPSARFGGCTEPGLQAGSPAAYVVHQADPAAIMTSVPGVGIINGAQILARLGGPARKTVAVAVGPGTIQVAVETSITVTAARTTNCGIRRHKASDYG